MDLTVIVPDAGWTVIGPGGTALGQGTKRAMDAAQAAICSPLLEATSIDGATGISKAPLPVRALGHASPDEVWLSTARLEPSTVRRRRRSGCTMKLSERVRQAIVAGVGRVLRTEDWDLFLFGSFARGEANRTSDIDLAVRTPEPLARDVEAKIVAELEDTVPTLRTFDLVDLAKAPEALRARILKEGELWHGSTT